MIYAHFHGVHPSCWEHNPQLLRNALSSSPFGVVNDVCAGHPPTWRGREPLPKFLANLLGKERLQSHPPSGPISPTCQLVFHFFNISISIACDTRLCLTREPVKYCSLSLNRGLQKAQLWRHRSSLRILNPAHSFPRRDFCESHSRSDHCTTPCATAPRPATPALLISVYSTEWSSIRGHYALTDSQDNGGRANSPRQFRGSLCSRKCPQRFWRSAHLRGGQVRGLTVYI